MQMMCDGSFGAGVSLLLFDTETCERNSYRPEAI
jgi:hypothetical protein